MSDDERSSYDKLPRVLVFDGDAESSFSKGKPEKMYERSQGLFALARLAAPTYCYWRYCVTCCAWVGVLGGGNKAPGDYMLAHFLSFWNKR